MRITAISGLVTPCCSKTRPHVLGPESTFRSVYICRLPCYPLLLLRLCNTHMLRRANQPSMSTKQNTQLAGTDTSCLGSKSQENKLPESTVHQAILHRKLKRQESRPSSRENERPETKPTVAQPVLHLKNSSTQSTSDPEPPPNQTLKHQETRYALLLFT